MTFPLARFRTVVVSRKICSNNSSSRNKRRFLSCLSTTTTTSSSSSLSEFPIWILQTNTNTTPHNHPYNQQQQRFHSTFAAATSSSSATDDFDVDDDGDDHDDNDNDNENTTENTSASSSSSSLFKLSIFPYNNDNNDNNNKNPWLISKCGPFSKEIQNQSPILRNDNNDNSTNTTIIDWEIPHPDDFAGIVVLGPNGIGKSTLTQAIVQPNATQWWYPIQQQQQQENEEKENDNNGNNNNTSKSSIPKWNPRIQHVSFEAHQELLEETSGGTSGVGVLKTIADGGQLNKAAQFLIVRLGLYGLLQRNVDTLSTGEIRKVLLVRALSRRPDLLILDNALDGLDVSSREQLQHQILQKTLQGFTNDILVQGINAKATARTQIIMMTHRPEEIMLGNVVIYPEYKNKTQNNNNENERLSLRMELRNGRSGEELLQLAMNQQNDHDNMNNNNDNSHPWDDPTLQVTISELQDWWNMGRQQQSNDNDDDDVDDNDIVVQAKQLSIHCINNRKDHHHHQQQQQNDNNDSNNDIVTLLHNLDWTIHTNQHWLLAGHNGAGKSTLSRLLVKQQQQQNDSGNNTNHLLVPPSDRIGWCSTELHMQMAKCTDSALSVLTRNFTTPIDIAMKMAQWMLLPTTNANATMTSNKDNNDNNVSNNDNDSSDNANNNHSFWNRPFSTLSQGQQKMVLLSAAMACRPSLLIMDEPCQGLDMNHRRRVLAMMEALCQATKTHNNCNHFSLIYITHHLEELIPSVQNVLHLKQGESVYNGSITTYQPEEYSLPSQQ